MDSITSKDKNLLPFMLDLSSVTSHVNVKKPNLPNLPSFGGLAGGGGSGCFGIQEFIGTGRRLRHRRVADDGYYNGLDVLCDPFWMATTVAAQSDGDQQLSGD